jgi:hypothetical protein
MEVMAPPEAENNEQPVLVKNGENLAEMEVNEDDLNNS